MSNLTEELYEHLATDCDGLCKIDHSRISKQDPTKMPCVKCPFCTEIVTAELTPTTISCPSCLVTVKR
jgi:hypothetical protein